MAYLLTLLRNKCAKFCDKIPSGCSENGKQLQGMLFWRNVYISTDLLLITARTLSLGAPSLYRNSVPYNRAAAAAAAFVESTSGWSLASIRDCNSLWPIVDLATTLHATATAARALPQPSSPHTPLTTLIV